jgi:hypothetical protein
VILQARRVATAPRKSEIRCRRFGQDPQIVVNSPLERLAHPGVLVWEIAPTAAPELYFASFLDIAAPEDVAAQELADAVSALVRLGQLPQSYAAAGSRVGFNLAVRGRIARSWQQEVLALVDEFFRSHP